MGGALSVHPADRLRDGGGARQGRGDTATLMQHDMWVMSVSNFVRLTELKPHQELLAEGKLVRWDASFRAVFFLSHQWTSFANPDHSTAQLRTVQTLLLRMMSGDVPKTTPAFAEQYIFEQDVSISAAEWKRIVPDAYLWLDYISVPQMAVESYVELSAEEEAGQRSELMKAVNSIPAYVERSTHFFCICPTVQHHDLPGVTCSYASWLERGWCRSVHILRA